MHNLPKRKDADSLSPSITAGESYSTSDMGANLEDDQLKPIQEENHGKNNRDSSF